MHDKQTLGNVMLPRNDGKYEKASVINLFINCNGIVFRYWRASTPRTPTKLPATTMKLQ